MHKNCIHTVTQAQARTREPESVRLEHYLLPHHDTLSLKLFVKTIQKHSDNKNFVRSS